MLPTLIDPITALALLAQADTITDIATSLVIQCECDPEFSDALNDHLAAVTCAMELEIMHESGHPADRDLHHCARQLRLWHLARLDTLTTVKP